MTQRSLIYHFIELYLSTLADGSFLRQIDDASRFSAASRVSSSSNSSMGPLPSSSRARLYSNIALISDTFI